MSEPQPSRAAAAAQLLSEYGMVAVLLLLCALFSALTWKQQHPTGADAGLQVAKRVLSLVQRESAGVLVVTRDTKEDRAFSDAAASVLRENGVTGVTIVNGTPADARRAIDAAVSESRSIDAVIANDVTARWTVFDRYAEIPRESIVTPTPYNWPDFLKATNLIGVANQTAIYAIIAIGMTMVIISAGIDLSVGSLVALAAVTAAIFVRDVGRGDQSGIGIVIAASGTGVLICAAAGAFVGGMVTRFKLPSFIVTLAMMLMASGLAFRLSEGLSIGSLPESFFWLGGGKTVGIPNPVWLMCVLYVIAHLVMSRTVFGRYVYAIGGNAEAARLSGVPVRRILLAVYTISGALAGLGGVVLASQLEAGDPKFGLMYELDVIAAVVVGGTSLMGGQGRIFGTLIGAFIIAVIKNGMNLTNVEPFNQKIVLGAVLLAAVWLDHVKRR